MQPMDVFSVCANEYHVVMLNGDSDEDRCCHACIAACTELIATKAECASEQHEPTHDICDPMLSYMATTLNSFVL